MSEWVFLRNGHCITVDFGGEKNLLLGRETGEMRKIWMSPIFSCFPVMCQGEDLYKTLTASFSTRDCVLPLLSYAGTKTFLKWQYIFSQVWRFTNISADQAPFCWTYLTPHGKFWWPLILLEVLISVFVWTREVHYLHCLRYKKSGSFNLLLIAGLVVCYYLIFF